MWLKLQIQYYHPLNQWLLGATNGKPRTKSDGPLKLVVYQPTIMGITAQNMP